MTQKEEVLKHLNEKGSITDLEAYRYYAIRRLAAQICVLRRAGYRIRTEDTEEKNRFGRTVHFATYILEK